MGRRPLRHPRQRARLPRPRRNDGRAPEQVRTLLGLPPELVPGTKASHSSRRTEASHKGPLLVREAAALIAFTNSDNGEGRDGFSKARLTDNGRR